MRIGTQKAGKCSPRSGVAKWQKQPRTAQKTPVKQHCVRGVRGWSRFKTFSEKKGSSLELLFCNAHIFSFNPGHPGQTPKNKGFFSSPGLQNGEMQPRTSDFRKSRCGYIVSADFRPETASFASFCLGSRRFCIRLIDGLGSGRKVKGPHPQRDRNEQAEEPCWSPATFRKREVCSHRDPIAAQCSGSNQERGRAPGKDGE